MKNVLSLIIILILLVNISFARTNVPKDSSEIIDKIEKKYLRSKPGPIHHFFKDIVIKSNEQIDGNIVTIKGDVDVYGKVDGDIVVYDGNAYIKNSAVVSGNITAVNGKIFLDNNAVVRGEMRETTSLFYFLGNKRHNYNFQYEFEGSPLTNFPGYTGDDFVFDYNRVDGLILGALFTPQYTESRQFSGYGSAAYAFNRNEWLYKAGIEHYFFNPHNKRLIMGVEGHNMSDFNDKWKIDSKTNTLAALLFGEDYFTYYNRRGISAYTNLKFNPVFLQVGYSADKIETLEAGRHLWHLFGNEENLFRPNLLLNKEGMNREIRVQLKYKTTDERDDILNQGWEAHAQADVSSEKLHSDYSFNRYTAQIKRFQKIGEREMLSLAGTVGTSEGELPDFMQYTAGGVGTIRGLPLNAYSGNRMVLLSAEWITPSEIIQPFDFGDNFYYGFFVDMGKAWNTLDTYKWHEGFSELTWNNLQKNAGISLKYNSNSVYFQIDFGWDISGTEKSPIVLLRLSPHF